MFRISLRKRLWYLIAGTRGGLNRARILLLLRQKPSNVNEVAEILDLDYKTVRHHLDVLHENGFVMVSSDQHYGALYSLAPVLQNHFEDFNEIWDRFGEK